MPVSRSIPASLFLSAGMAVLAIGPAQAASLPPIAVHAFASVSVSEQERTSLGDASASYEDGQGASGSFATASVSGGLDPAVRVSADSGGMDLFGNPPPPAFASGSLDYSFAVVGPPGGKVPVIVTAAGQATAPFDEARGALSIGDLLSLEVCSSDFDCPASSFTIRQSYAVDANLPILVRMSAEARSDLPGDSAWASIDPTIAIDPAFADAGQYSVVFSPGLAAPIPSAWTEMAIGLGMIGLAAFRRGRSKSR